MIRCRGEARTPGQVLTCDILCKDNDWYASIVVACEPHRERTGDRIAGLDWGVETFATLAYGPEEFVEIPNERLLNAETDAIRALQRAVSRSKRSKSRDKRLKLLAKRHRKVANRRKNMLHQATARLAREHRLIVTEQLTVTNMTASAKGTVEKPGKNVAQKAGLNRAILDTAPGGFHSMLAWKAEEAACEIIDLNTRKERPSQTCPRCGSVRKKSLSERVHHCLDCDLVMPRDRASALGMLITGCRLAGLEQSWMAGFARSSETAAKAA